MSDEAYIVCGDKRIPVKRSLFSAFERFYDLKLNGSVTAHVKNGGVAAVEDQTKYHDSVTRA